MSERKQEAVQMIDRLPEEKVEFVIQYIRQLEITSLDKEAEPSPKMKAFLELEKMLVPAAEDLDYDRELAEARDEKKHFHIDIAASI